MNFTTTITKKNFDMKMVDLKYLDFFEEYKEVKKFWETRYNHITLPCNATFLVGNKPFKFILIDKKIINRWEVPEKYYNAISTPQAFAFRCIRSI